MINKELYKTIMDQAAASGMRNLEVSEIMKTKRKLYIPAGLKAALIAAAVLLLCGGTAAAGALAGFWGNGLDRSIRGNAAQKEKLTAEGYAVNINDAEPVTVNGVTITPQAAVTDGRVGYVSLRVEGYSFDEREGWPAFEKGSGSFLQDESEPEWTTEGLNYWSGGDYMEGFFNGVVSYKDGTAYFADGAEAEYDAFGSIIGRYKNEDGSLEYIAQYLYTGDDSLLGKNLSFCLENLHTRKYRFSEEDRIEDINIVEGSWEFDVTFQGGLTVGSKTIILDEKLEEAGCRISEISLSPLSASITYNISFEGDVLELKKLILKSGEAIELSDLNHPYFKAVTAPGIDCCTITALGNVVDTEDIKAIGVSYFGWGSGIAEEKNIELP